MRSIVAVIAFASAVALAGAAHADEGPPATQPTPQMETSGSQPGSQKARVTFTPPADVKGLSVTFDGARVPVGSMATRAFTIEPGRHKVHATGIRAGNEVAYEAEFQIEPGQFVLIALPMTEVAGASGSPQASGCLSPTKTEEEVNQCIAAKVPPQSGCGTCLVAPPRSAEPTPLTAWLLLALPLVALWRRRRTAARHAAPSDPAPKARR
jgi:hypothetical protein